MRTTFALPHPADLLIIADSLWERHTDRSRSSRGLVRGLKGCLQEWWSYSAPPQRRFPAWTLSRPSCQRSQDSLCWLEVVATFLPCVTGLISEVLEFCYSKCILRPDHQQSLGLSRNAKCSGITSHHPDRKLFCLFVFIFWWSSGLNSWPCSC
jgi:hypothetical protein